MGMDINETGNLGMKDETREQGRMEGCQRCNGNRTDLGMEKV